MDKVQELNDWLNSLEKAKENIAWIEYQITKTKMEIRDALYHRANVCNQQRKEKDGKGFYVVGAEVIDGVEYLELESVFDGEYARENPPQILVPLNYFEDKHEL